MTDDCFPKLDLEKFAHGYSSFYEATCKIMELAESAGVLKYILTDDLMHQYNYSNEKRSGYPITWFLKQKYLNGNNEVFISFFNEIIPNINKYIEAEYWEVDSVHRDLRSVISEFSNLIHQSNNSKVFKLDFYYDEQGVEFKRKLDAVNIESINYNNKNVGSDNKDRYQECVTDFLSYKRDTENNNKLFYNESLDRLKRVIENTLQNDFKRPDGSYPMIHKTKEISNILFDKNNTEFENLVSYIIKNVHHEEGGAPKCFSEKEYVYLWLEMNKILYLLNRYKK